MPLADGVTVALRLTVRPNGTGSEDERTFVVVGLWAKRGIKTDVSNSHQTSTPQFTRYLMLSKPYQGAKALILKGYGNAVKADGTAARPTLRTAENETPR